MRIEFFSVTVPVKGSILEVLQVPEYTNEFCYKVLAEMITDEHRKVSK